MVALAGRYMNGVDYRLTSLHYNRGISMQDEKGRTREESNWLPVHMQHNNGRLAMNVHKYDSSINRRDIGFIDPVSTFNTRKDFHVDAKKKRFEKTMALLNSEKEGEGGKKNTAKVKKNLTFNQLLSKFGYI